MNTLVEIRDNLIALKTEIARIKSEFLFRKFVMQLLKQAFEKNNGAMNSDAGLLKMALKSRPLQDF